MYSIRYIKDMVKKNNLELFFYKMNCDLDCKFSSHIRLDHESHNSPLENYLHSFSSDFTVTVDILSEFYSS